MAVARVQFVGQQLGEVASQTLAFDDPTTAGNLIGVAVASYNPGVTHGISDNKGNSYTSEVLEDSPDGGQPYRIEIFFAKNILGGSSHEVTLTPSGNAWLSMAIVEYEVIDATDPVEGSDSDTGTGTGPATTSSLTLAGNGVILAIMATGYPSFGFSPSSGWNLIAKDEDVNDQPFIVIDRLVSSGSYTPSFDLGGATNTWATAAVAFKEAVAPSGGPFPFFLRRAMSGGLIGLGGGFQG